MPVSLMRRLLFLGWPRENFTGLWEALKRFSGMGAEDRKPMAAAPLTGSVIGSG